MNSFQGSNPAVGEIFRTVQIGRGAHPAYLYNGYRVFPVGKSPGRGVDHPPHLSPRLKEEYSYISTPPFGSSWPVIG